MNAGANIVCPMYPSILAPSMLQICEQRRTSWQVLQEIAGLVTPFTERVEQAARDQVAADHEAELAALRREY